MGRAGGCKGHTRLSGTARGVPDFLGTGVACFSGTVQIHRDTDVVL